MFLQLCHSVQRQTGAWLLAVVLALTWGTAARAQLLPLPPVDELDEPPPLVEPGVWPRDWAGAPQPDAPLDEDGEDGDFYTRQWLPRGILYRSYLAGEKESRFRSFWSYEKTWGWIWDISLGGRVPIFRYGTSGDQRPEGFQVDIEGAGLPRLDMEHQRDLMSVDFRFGVPITFGNRYFQTKFAYYHLSSHLGDEFLLRFPGYNRLNYSRDVLVLGQSIYLTDDLRIYGEAGWAFYSDVAEPWEFQFGLDYSPGQPTGRRGAPFLALNGHLREEVGFGGNFVVQTGWAWRSRPTGGLMRVGMEYFNGKSDQFAFYQNSESKVGLAIWYDY